MTAAICGRADQGHLPARQVPPAAGAPGYEEGGRGGRAQDPGRRVPHPASGPSPSPTSGPTTSTASTSTARPSASSAASTPSATTSCSGPRPRHEPYCRAVAIRAGAADPNFGPAKVAGRVGAARAPAPRWRRRVAQLGRAGRPGCHHQVGGVRGLGEEQAGIAFGFAPDRLRVGAANVAGKWPGPARLSSGLALRCASTISAGRRPTSRPANMAGSKG